MAIFSAQLINLSDAWNTEEYSHGYLIPFIAILIAWYRLTHMPLVKIRCSWLGLVFMSTGLIFHVIAQLSAFEPISYYGFWLCLVGLILGFLGRTFTWRITPALIYLIFCIPLPRLIEVTLSSNLMLISSNLGVSFLQLLGISVFQDGNIIDLGVHKLQVVEACSGLRYLFPLMSLSFLVALMLEDRMWKRIIIFSSAVPIAIGMNALRIALVGISVNWGGEELAEGIIHDLQGWMIFLLCLSVLLIETILLIHIGKHKGKIRFDYFAPSIMPAAQNTPTLKAPAIILLIICAGFYIFQSTGAILDRPQNKPIHSPFFTFPTEFNEWKGKQGALEASILDTLKLTDYLSNNYIRPNDETAINLYMAYYDEQGIGISIHSPANCIPGSGWDISSRKVIGVGVGNKTVPMSRMIIKKDGSQLLVYYWFFQRGRIINDQYGAKFYLLLDSVLKNRSDGALIRVTTEIKEDEIQENADKRIAMFLKETYTTIESYIPK
jgi:exosortase D (VPLPA-CTERM-specific)